MKALKRGRSIVAHGSRARARGYTAVEVMLALTVLAIGAAGVMSMQTGAIQGNLEARKLDMANSIAREWVERIRRDATVWTTPGVPTNVSNLPADPLLASGIALPAGTWVLPPIPGTYPADGQSPAFDLLGRDLAGVDAAKAVYCVHVKLDLVANSPANSAQGAQPELVRATVRVFWLRQLNWSAPPPVGCSNSTPGGGFDPTAYPTTYHTAYASTAIRKSPLQ